MRTLLKGISRRFGVGTVVVIAAVLVLPAGASAASQATFEKQFLSYLTDMRQVAVTVESTARGRAAYAQLGVDPATAIARARSVVERMSPAELAVLQRAFATVPDYREQPDVLQGTLRRSGLSAGGKRRALGVGPDCDPGPGTPLGITDFYIAAGVALGLEATHVAIPDDVLTAPAQIAAGIAWGVAAGVALTLEGLNAVEAECEGAKLEDFTRTRLDVNISTRASQSSFDAFTTNFNGLSTLVNSRLDVAVSTRATQASLDVFHNEFTTNATTVNTKLDSLTTTVGDQGALSLRLQIEADLSESGDPVALFALPSSANGYLELSREIVLDIITKTEATGQRVGKARKYLDFGDAARAKGDFKSAYEKYGKAYREAADGGDHDDHDDDHDD